MTITHMFRRYAKDVSIEVESAYEASAFKNLVDDFENGRPVTSGCPIVRMLCTAYGVDATIVPPARWTEMVPSLVDVAKSALLKYYEGNLSK